MRDASELEVTKCNYIQDEGRQWMQGPWILGVIQLERGGRQSPISINKLYPDYAGTEF